MRVITQKSRHPWIVISFIITVLASIGFLTSGCYHWPPQLNFSWIVGTLVTIGTMFCAINNGIRLFYTVPYSFELSDNEITIRDWGAFKPRVRRFTASNVKEIFHSTIDGAEGSFLTTKDGKTHYIDDVLMLKYRDIFKLINEKYSHIATIAKTD